MTDDDHRLAQRLRAYESRVPDAPEPSTTFASRPPWAIFAGVGAAAILGGAVLAANLSNDSNVGDVDATLTPEPSVGATLTPEASGSPGPTKAPTTAPSGSPSAPPPTEAPSPAATDAQAARGVDWDDSATVSESTVFRVTSEGGRFFALGYDGLDAFVWSSTDGTSWQRAGLPSPAGWDRERGSVWVDEMAAIDGRLVAVGELINMDDSRVIVWESTDGGQTWRELDTGEFRDVAYMVKDIAAGPRELVAISRQYVAGAGSAWRSDDGGRTWSEHRPPGDGVDPEVVVGTSRGYLIGGAVGTDTDASRPRIWYSPDGTGSGWREAALEGSGGTGVVEHLAIDASARWVALGVLNGESVAWRSLDRGLTWELAAQFEAASFENRSFGRVIGAPDGFVAVSGTDPMRTWVSPDGATWTETGGGRPSNVPEDRGMAWQRGLARIGDRLVIVGSLADQPSEWISWAGTITR